MRFNCFKCMRAATDTVQNTANIMEDLTDAVPHNPEYYAKKYIKSLMPNYDKYTIEVKVGILDIARKMAYITASANNNLLDERKSLFVDQNRPTTPSQLKKSDDKALITAAAKEL